MKTILAAVDFTAASHNAALYAVELAKAFDARLVVFNAYVPVPIPLSEALVTVAPDDQEPYIEERLNKLAKELDPSWNIDIGVSIARGRASDCIKQAALTMQADLIILGMKHMHHDVRRIFGSTVTDLIGKTSVPLLVVPEEASFQAPQYIALATNSDIAADANIHIADALCDIGQQFRSRLYIVKVVNNVPENGFRIPETLHSKVGCLAPEYVYPYGLDVSKSLQQFVEKKHIDILAMIPHQHTFFEKLFLGSQTKAMAFATHIPLLVLPEMAE
jgi:nucleotide-binding universal stress UspA family protein